MSHETPYQDPVPGQFPLPEQPAPGIVPPVPGSPHDPGAPEPGNTPASPPFRPIPPGDYPHTGFSFSLAENLQALRDRFGGSSDLMIHPFRLHEVNAALLACEGMIDQNTLACSILQPLTERTAHPLTPDALLPYVRERLCLSMDQQDVTEPDKLCRFLMSGFVCLLLDGVNQGLALGMQGYSFRSVSEPANENNVRGGREGFVEVVRVNMTMLRRRMKTTDLCFEMRQVGKKSSTDVCLCYLRSAVSQEVLAALRKRLDDLPLDVVLESGYLQPFLEGRKRTLFPCVGTTERPDTAIAKLTEGRVVLLTDGTPHALVVPYLFVENFQSFDDYTQSPWYITLTRILRFAAFLVTVLLPGVYVAVATWHPGLLPAKLLYNLLDSDSPTPFPLWAEAVFMQLLYQLMMEAGLRLPRPVGHAISILGALVVGEAIVKAGLVTSTMVTVIALTAIASFVLPALYGAVTVMRFSSILLGGFFGLYGVLLGAVTLLTALCRAESFAVPYLAPLTPFTPAAMRDVFVRQSWRKLGKRTANITQLETEGKT